MSGFPRYAAWHCIRWCSINPIIVLMWCMAVADCIVGRQSWQVCYLSLYMLISPLP